MTELEITRGALWIKMRLVLEVTGDTERNWITPGFVDQVKKFIPYSWNAEKPFGF